MLGGLLCARHASGAAANVLRASLLRIIWWSDAILKQKAAPRLLGLGAAEFTIPYDRGPATSLLPLPARGLLFALSGALLCASRGPRRASPAPIPPARSSPAPPRRPCAVRSSRCAYSRPRAARTSCPACRTAFLPSPSF